jgi:hypothetical protein
MSTQDEGHPDHVSAGLDALAALVPLVNSGRLRAASIQAILRLAEEPGTLVVHRPRSDNRPIEASFISGGIEFTISESRQLGPLKP